MNKFEPVLRLCDEPGVCVVVTREDFTITPEEERRFIADVTASDCHPLAAMFLAFTGGQTAAAADTPRRLSFLRALDARLGDGHQLAGFRNIEVGARRVQDDRGRYERIVACEPDRIDVLAHHDVLAIGGVVNFES